MMSRTMLWLLVCLIFLSLINACGESVSGGEELPFAIIINDAAEITTTPIVSLTLTAPSYIKEMLIYNKDMDGWYMSWMDNPPSWEDFSSPKEWYVADDEGTKEVFVKFRDVDEKEYGPYSDTIIYDPHSGEVKVIAKDLIGTNKFRLKWINPIEENFKATLISAETPSVVEISATQISGLPGQLSSCEVTTNGVGFSLNFKSVDSSGDPSTGISHYFPPVGNLEITPEVYATSFNIIIGYGVKNNGSEMAESVKVSYGFHDSKNNQFRRATGASRNIQPGETISFAITTSLFWSDSWEVYSRFLESEKK